MLGVLEVGAFLLFENIWTFLKLYNGITIAGKSNQTVLTFSQKLLGRSHLSGRLSHGNPMPPKHEYIRGQRYPEFIWDVYIDILQ